jgi:hypothetical protein
MLLPPYLRVAVRRNLCGQIRAKLPASPRTSVSSLAASARMPKLNWFSQPFDSPTAIPGGTHVSRPCALLPATRSSSRPYYYLITTSSFIAPPPTRSETRFATRPRVALKFLPVGRLLRPRLDQEYVPRLACTFTPSIDDGEVALHARRPVTV